MDLAPEHRSTEVPIYLSIVVPIRNEERFITDTLQMLLEQDYPKDRYEIIVVDGHSNDSSCAKVREFANKHPDANIVLHENPKLWSSAGRNLGIQAAKGRLIAIIDGHVHIPNTQLFANMERLKEESGALCLARPAPLLIPDMNEGLPFWIAVARATWLGHSQKSYIYSCYEGFVDPMSSGFAYDQALFAQVGYFDENFDAAEDVEFHHRLKVAGILAYTADCLKIYSFPRPSFKSLFNQMVRYGIGRARLFRKHPRALSKETLVPPLVLLMFAALPFALLAIKFSPIVADVYFCLLGLYFTIVMVVSLTSSLRRGRLLPGFQVATAVVLTHLGLGWGFLRAVLIGSPSDSRVSEPVADR